MNSKMICELEKIALKFSQSFCGACNRPTNDGRCVFCDNEDLWRYIKGIGVDFGLNWVIEHILKTRLQKVNLSQEFEAHVSAFYPPYTKIGWIDFDTIFVLKELEPISWEVALQEFTESLLVDEQIVTFDNGRNYYWVDDVKKIIDVELR